MQAESITVFNVLTFVHHDVQYIMHCTELYAIFVGYIKCTIVYIHIISSIEIVTIHISNLNIKLNIVSGSSSAFVTYWGGNWE